MTWAMRGIGVRLWLPKGFRAKTVRFLSPDAEAEETLEFTQCGGAVEFKTPRFLVYGVCVVQE